MRGREIFGPTRLGPGAWPDGIAFDSFGNLWGTLVYSDKLFVLTPEESSASCSTRAIPRKCKRSSCAFLDNRVTADVLFTKKTASRPGWQVSRWAVPISRTVYIGSLKGHRIPFFRSPVPGLPMAHWPNGRGN